jgi:hypothetical protein
VKILDPQVLLLKRHSVIYYIAEPAALLKRHLVIYYIAEPAGRVRENTRPADPHVLLLKRHSVIYYIAGRVRENTRPAGSSFKEALTEALTHMLLKRHLLMLLKRHLVIYYIAEPAGRVRENRGAGTGDRCTC